MESNNEYRKLIGEIVSKKLVEVRSEFNLSQSELGKILNVPQTTIGSIECGRREIQIKEVYLLAVHLKVNINWLLSLSDNKFDANTHVKHLKNLSNFTKTK